MPKKRMKIVDAFAGMGGFSFALGSRYKTGLYCEISKKCHLVLNCLMRLVEWQWGLVDGVKAKKILLDKYDDCLAREYPRDPRVLLNPECVANVLNEKLMRSLPDYQTRSW